MSHLLWVQDPKNNNVKIHVVYFKNYKTIPISLQYMMDMVHQEEKLVKQQMIIFHQSFKKVHIKGS